jgi:hypothetical protein
VSKVVFPVASEKLLRDVIKEHKAKSPAFRQQVHTIMRASYSYHYRRIIPELLDILEFRLHRNTGIEVDAFWETYGQPEKGLGAQFRMLIYQGRYVGGARLEHYRLRHHEAVKRSYQDMQTIIKALRSLPTDGMSQR